MKLLNVDYVEDPNVEGIALYHLGRLVKYIEVDYDWIAFLKDNVVHISGVYRADLSTAPTAYEYPNTLSEIKSLVKLK